MSDQKRTVDDHLARIQGRQEAPPAKRLDDMSVDDHLARLRGDLTIDKTTEGDDD